LALSGIAHSLYDLVLPQLSQFGLGHASGGHFRIAKRHCWMRAFVIDASDWNLPEALDPMP